MMTIEIPLGRMLKYFLRLLLVAFLLGSYPANWWMMKHNLGFYAPCEKWQEKLKSAARAVEEGVSDSHRVSDLVDGSPHAGDRAWALVLSPVFTPSNLVYWLADETINLDKVN